MRTSIQKSTVVMLMCILLSSIVMVGCGKTTTKHEQLTGAFVDLPIVTVDLCDEVEYPILGARMANIYGIELYINYESDKATFDSLTSIYFDADQTEVSVTGGVIHITWVDMSLSPVSVSNEDTIMTLYFSDLSGTCQISFSSFSEIYDDKGDPINLYDDDDELINIEDLSGSITCE